MPTDLGPCSISECPNRADRDTIRGALCAAHRRRQQPSRAGGLKLSAPITPRLDPRAKLLEAALAYAQAEEDGDFAEAEEQLVVAAKRYAPASVEEMQRRTHMAWLKSVKAGIARRKAAGRSWRPGPAAELTPEQARDAVAKAGSIRKAARALGMNRRTVQRALRRLPGYPTATPSSVPALPQSQPVAPGEFQMIKIVGEESTITMKAQFVCEKCGEAVPFEWATPPHIAQDDVAQATRLATFGRHVENEHAKKCPKAKG